MKNATTSQWNVAKTSQWYVFTTSYWYATMTSHGNVMTPSHQYVSITPQMKHPMKYLSAVVRHHNVSVVRIHYIPLVRLYDVFCNSHMKHSITQLWYVSTTSWSYVVARPCLQYRLYCVLYFKLLCLDPHLVGFQVSFKHQIKHHIFQVLTRWETRGVVSIINQQNFYYI